MSFIDITEKESRDQLRKIIADSDDRLRVNDRLIQILHGNMYDPLKEKLKEDMPQAWRGAIDRVMPINYFLRIMNKITHIYQTGVKREIQPESDSDQEAMEVFADEVGLNDELDYNNLLFNSFGYSLQSISKDSQGKPYTVAVDNNHFIPVNMNDSRKNKMDLLILLMGKEGTDQIYWVWTDDQFMIMDSKGEIRYEMIQNQYDIELSPSELTTNPYGKIPYIYLTKSRTKIMPEVAKDNLQIALVLAILMSDMNYISKYTAFAIVYTIDMDVQQLPQVPNATWNLKSGSGQSLDNDKKPSIGTIKPDGDIAQLIQLFGFELSSWLEQFGINPGTMGTLSGNNFASGIAKIIDEMDVSEVREKQTKAFSKLEGNFFNLLFHSINPLWVNQPTFNGNRHVYSPMSAVETSFPIQRPIVNKKEALDEIKVELELGLTTKRRAIKKINPDMDEAEIDDLISDLEAEAAMVNNIDTENDTVDEDSITE